ncbi:MAG: bacillithiol biosynthesis cysteine-adding enzyme BshC [Cytophagaceae bacterium]
MRVTKIDPSNIGVFSSLYLDYLSQNENVREFYDLFPTQKNFKVKAERKKFSTEKRATLQDALIRQYNGIEKSDKIKSNIELLNSPNTFTVTTGHQLNLFTGPVYFIYKIVSVISICTKLAKLYPEFNFIPVYWMASEDHDFAEINHFHLFGKKYEWSDDQSGPVGRFKTEGIRSLADTLPEEVKSYAEHYLTSRNLSEATRKFVNTLFGEEGLLIIDGDDRNLKSLFAPAIKKELKESFSFKTISEVISSLDSKGYKIQVNPREVNLFYMSNGIRERIIREGEELKVLNTDITIPVAEIDLFVNDFPENFSPNVVLRPLYQETILPNIAYVGGPAEIIYWLELKNMFQETGEEFPLLVPRLSAMVVNEGVNRKIQKLRMSAIDFFSEISELKEKYLSSDSETNYDDMAVEEVELKRIFASMADKAAAIDKTLEAFVHAEAKKAESSIESIRKKVKKAAEKKSDVAIAQINGIKSKLFPGDGLQERHDNFLNFLISNPDFISQLSILDPFDYRFNILETNA